MGRFPPAGALPWRELAGRTAEQAAISAAIESARNGLSSVLVLAGEPGSGKSALLDSMLASAAGMRLLRARGIESEATVPFSGLLELLRPVLHLIDAIPAPQASAIERALALRPASAEDRFAVGAATLSLLAAAAEEAPLLVAVDDAHWVDGSSARALLFAFRRLLADPIAVLIAVRAAEPSFVDGSSLPTIRLEGLDLDATRQLLALRLDRELPAEVIDRFHRQTGGNPLAVLELAGHSELLEHAWPIDTPVPVMSRVVEEFVTRCRSLPPESLDAMLLAAASDTGDVSVLTRAAPALGTKVTELVPAERLGLLRLAEGRVEFRHPLIRSAVYADARPDRRRLAHRALAAVLPDFEADRRAWHLALGALGPDDAACSALEQAGNRARSRSAYEVAARAFERAAEIASRDERRARMLCSAAESAWAAGDATKTVALLEEARRYRASEATLVTLEHWRGHVTTRIGPVREGLQILAAAAEMAHEIDAELAVVMLAEVVNAGFFAGDTQTMKAAGERIAGLMPEDASEPCRFYAAVAQGMALVFSGDTAAGTRLLREAARVTDQGDEASTDNRLLTWAVMRALWLRESRESRACLDLAVAVARGRMEIGTMPYLLSHLAIDQAASDQWAEAEASFYEVVALARETEQRTDLAAALSRLAWLEARLGREADCRMHAAEALGLSGELGLGLCEIWSIAAVGELELVLGNDTSAIRLFDRQESLLQSLAIGDIDLSPGPELVELHLRAGRRARGADLAEIYDDRARRKGQPWALARAERSRGLVAPEQDMDEHFERALELHSLTPDGFERARTEVAYGARLRRRRQRLAARRHLRAALLVFDGLGAEPWSELARRELAATGETARKRDPSTHDQLSPQELQIALLLGQGRTTKEAASALFLSPKTVEFHLRSVYRKLGIGSREQLSHAMSKRSPAAGAPWGPSGESGD